METLQTDQQNIIEEYAGEAALYGLTFPEVPVQTHAIDPQRETLHRFGALALTTRELVAQGLPHYSTVRFEVAL